jgi:hypothetical protein
MDKTQFNCECGHEAEDHAEGFMGNGTRCRKCDCRRYRLASQHSVQRTCATCSASLNFVGYGRYQCPNHCLVIGASC